jgi:hypothetical protein
MSLTALARQDKLSFVNHDAIRAVLQLPVTVDIRILADKAPVTITNAGIEIAE